MCLFPWLVYQVILLPIHCSNSKSIHHLLNAIHGSSWFILQEKSKGVWVCSDTLTYKSLVQSLWSQECIFLILQPIEVILFAKGSCWCHKQFLFICLELISWGKAQKIKNWSKCLTQFSKCWLLGSQECNFLIFHHFGLALFAMDSYLHPLQLSFTCQSSIVQGKASKLKIIPSHYVLEGD